MNHLWPPPPIKPFQRLHVTDGLLMSAERWRLDRDYHRLRQNVQFQSLNQPGIVSDLGVSPIAPPDEITPQYRDGRWVQIQPGIAIDVFGNFVVVAEPVDFRITSKAFDEPLLVYLTVSYVDPDTLEHGNGDTVTETFRIDEKNTPPQDWEVELCRIVIAPGEVQLTAAENVFAPDRNQLDLRYRYPARSRPEAIVRAAVFGSDNERARGNLAYLMQAVEGLYPALQGDSDIGQVDLNPTDYARNHSNYDLLYLTYEQFQSLGDDRREALAQYLEIGGVVFVEATRRDSTLDELLEMKAQLQVAIANLQSEQDANGLQGQLQSEILEIDNEVNRRSMELCQSLQQFHVSLSGHSPVSGAIDRHHLLRNQPFLFAQFPRIDRKTVQLFNWGGIVLVIGELAMGWGLDEAMQRSRESLRAAQELGVNLLHFAWRRRQLTQWQQGDRRSNSPNLPLANDV
jgi:hypothetical protein